MQSITKVEDIHTSPLRTKRRQKSEGGATRHRVKNSDLPHGTADRFAKKVLPIALDAIASEDPWGGLDDDDIIFVWNQIFGPDGENDHPIANGDVNGALFLAVKSLVHFPLYY